MIPYFIFSTINIGSLALHTWGLFAGLAFAAALFIALKEAKRKNIKEDYILDLAVLVLFGGVVGARAAFILENWNYFSRNQAEILSFKEGGLMFFGGAIGAIFLAGAYMFFINRKLAKAGQEKISLIYIADALVPSFATGEFIGRIGCALSDLHIGATSSLPWAQAYIDGSLRHPISIYMSLNGLAMFIVFWFLRKKVKIKGALFLFFVLWYSGIRFFLDFLRCDDLNICDPRYWGWTPSQYLSTAAFIISLIYLINILKNSSISFAGFLAKLTGGKKHMSEQEKSDTISENEKANENKDLQGSVVSYTEIEEVVFESNTGSSAVSSDNLSKGAKLKEKLKVIIKKPLAHALAIIVLLLIGAAISAIYYNSVYYGNMFKSSPFAFQGKTWVSYDESIVKAVVINDSKCEICNSESIVKYLKTGMSSTLDFEEISFDSQKGKDLIDKFNIKSIPAFVFDSAVVKLKTFEASSPEEIGQIFTVKDNQHYLNSIVVNSIANRMGVSLGKFIVLPQITGEDRSKGLVSAPLTVIEFSDFKCPYCKEENTIMNQVLSAYPDNVRLVFKHLPLSIHPEAQAAAEAAECAGDQGKFFEIADVFFAKQDKLDAVSIARYARDLKLDVKKFKECVDSGKFKRKIENDSKIAADFGIGGTPAFFIGDEFVSTAISLEEFKKIIDAKLVK